MLLNTNTRVSRVMVMSLGSEKPDLPELESLEVRLRGRAALTASWHDLDHWWQTDHRGIFAIGFRRKRFIAWDDIKIAWTEYTETDDIEYGVSSGETEFMIPLKIAAQMRLAEKLAASIWQHLRRLGKERSLVLPEDAHSFWMDIPDCIPREIQWRNRLTKIHVDDDSYTVKSAVGCVSVDWSHVTFARWCNTITGRDGILIGSSRPRSRVFLPFIAEDEDSCRMALAVIRRLRTAGQPQAVPIPHYLRKKLVSLF